MAKCCFSLNGLSIFILISIFCAVWTSPTSSEVDLVQENNPTEENAADDEQKDYGDDQPMYEYQFAVWPDQYLGSVQDTSYPNSAYAPQFEDQEVVFPDLSDVESQSGDSQVNPTIPTWQNPQTVTKPPVPQSGSDIMAAIFPDINFDEAEALEDQNDEDVNHDLIGGVQAGLVTQRPTVPKPHVEVIEQYQMVHPNGTTEYKLVLSNGMTNYKKIYNKLMSDGKLVTVQEGYDSVPIPGDDPYSNEFQTQFYIADEHGHNVYKVEKHTRRPKLPQYLDYKLQLGKF